MPRENLSAPISMTISAVPGSLGSAVSGVTAGGQQSGQVSSKVLQESNLVERDSLLKALNILCNDVNEFREEKAPGLNLFPEDLQLMLGFTHNGVASTVGQLLLSPAITASHLAQLPLDVRASIEGLLHSVQDYQQFSQTQKASTLNIEQELQEQKTGFSANSHALWAHLSDISKELEKHINNDFEPKDSAAKSHRHLAKSSATLASAGSLGTASLIALVIDLLGSSLRELSAIAHYSQEESSNPQEKNVYRTLSACSQTLIQSKNSHESLLALRHLEEALCNVQQANEMREHHSVTGPGLSVLTRLLTAVPFVKTLQSVNASALALTAAYGAQNKERDNLSQQTHDSAARASLIKDFSGGDAPHHSQNVSDFCQQFDKAIEHIDGELQHIQNPGLIASSAASTARSNSALIIASSLLPGFMGLISRELSGSIDFTRNDRGIKQESHDILQTRQQMSGADLDKLMSRVCALADRLERCRELGVSAPVALGIGEAVTSGSLIAALNVIAGMYSALRELRTLAESPSIPLQLNGAERLQAEEYAQSAVDSNKSSAKFTGTGPVSENLSLHQHLQSIMDRVVLTHRSYRNVIQPEMERNDLDFAGKSTIAFVQGNSTGFLFGALGVLALIGLQSGISAEALLGGLRYSLAARRLSDGVDKIESGASKFNLSFASNATRLAEQSMGSSVTVQSSTKATHHLAETAFSRSLTVALCHSGALKEMMRRMITLEEEKLKQDPAHLNSALVSDAIMPGLYGNILEVLNDAEANHNPILGLNDNMASQLATVTNSSIAATLSTHSALIVPVLKSIIAAKKASVIDDELKNEAVSAQSVISKVLSESLNIIQAFTHNFKEEFKEIKEPHQHSTVAPTAAKSSETSVVAACAASLLCEELFEICISRSLTLLDREKIAVSSQKSKELIQDAARLSRQGVAEDSALDQEHNFTHIISALRLTVSHLGVSLGHIASEMEKSPDIVQDELQIHSAQQSLINNMASVFSECSASMLALSGLLSTAPLSSAGSVDALRELIHSMDNGLVLRPQHSSERSTKASGFESCLLTAIGTDCVSSIMSTTTKLLLQASILGLDTSLSIAKIMEILCIHQRPFDASALEVQALTQPNGSLPNTNEQSQSVLIAASIGTAGASLATKTGESSLTEDSIAALQAAINQRIDSIALLADEDEDDSLDLKKFYGLLIRILSYVEVSNNNVSEVIQRFHRGGLNLSSYHSEHGGIIDNQRKQNPNSLIADDGCLGCDDARSLLDKFIRTAISREHTSRSALDELKREMSVYKKLSPKTQESWEFIVNKVVDRLRLDATRSSMFSRGNLKRPQQGWEGRKQDLLHNWELPKAEYEPIPDPVTLNH